MTCEEVQELITGLVDGQLREAERAAVENHFKACTRCRFLYAQEQNLKKAIHTAGRELRISPAMKERLVSDPRIFGAATPKSKRWISRLAGQTPLMRGALAAAVFLLIVLLPAYLAQRDGPSISILATQSYRRFLENDNLSVKTTNLDVLKQALTRAVDGRFHPMAYDFSAMRTHLVGGAVQEFAGRNVMVTRYYGPDRSLLCFTFIGTEADAPSMAATFRDAEKHLVFYAFSVGNVNAVLHREDDIICILASEISMADLLNLARAKAKPQKQF